MQPVSVRSSTQPIISFWTALACALVLACTLVYLDESSRRQVAAQAQLTEDDLAIALFCASMDPRHQPPSARAERGIPRPTAGERVVFP